MLTDNDDSFRNKLVSTCRTMRVWFQIVEGVGFLAAGAFIRHDQDVWHNIKRVVTQI